MGSTPNNSPSANAAESNHFIEELLQKSVLPLLAALTIAMGSPNEGLKYVCEIKNAETNPEVCIWRIHALLLSNQFKCFKKEFKTAPGFLNPRQVIEFEFLRANAEFKMGNFKKAPNILYHCEQNAGEDQFNSYYKSLLENNMAAISLMQQKPYIATLHATNALRWQQQFVSLDVDVKGDKYWPMKMRSAEMHYTLGLSQLQTGHYVEAVESFKKNVQVYHDNYHAYLHMAEAHIAANTPRANRVEEVIVDTKSRKARFSAGLVASAESATSSPVKQQNNNNNNAEDKQQQAMSVSTARALPSYQVREPCFGVSYYKDQRVYMLEELNQKGDLEAIVKEKMDNGGSKKNENAPFVVDDNSLTLGRALSCLKAAYSCLLQRERTVEQDGRLHTEVPTVTPLASNINTVKAVIRMKMAYVELRQEEYVLALKHAKEVIASEAFLPNGYVTLAKQYAAHALAYMDQVAEAVQFLIAGSNSLTDCEFYEAPSSMNGSAVPSYNYEETQTSNRMKAVFAINTVLAYIREKKVDLASEILARNEILRAVRQDPGDHPAVYRKLVTADLHVHLQNNNLKALKDIIVTKCSLIPNKVF